MNFSFHQNLMVKSVAKDITDSNNKIEITKVYVMSVLYLFLFAYIVLQIFVAIKIINKLKKICIK